MTPYGDIKGCRVSGMYRGNPIKGVVYRISKYEKDDMYHVRLDTPIMIKYRDEPGPERCDSVLLSANQIYNVLGKV